MTNRKISKGVGIKSIMFKMAAVVVLMTAVIVGLMSIMSFRTANIVAAEGVHTQGHSVTQLMAGQLRPAVKFSKTEPIVELFSSAEAVADGALVAGVVLNKDGNVLASHGDISDDLKATAMAALTNNTEAFSNNELTIGQPIVSKPGEPPIGSIAIAWTTDSLVAMVLPQKMNALGVSGLAFVLGIAGILIFVRQSVTGPMQKLGRGVDAVASKKFDTNIDGTGRGDEIGALAKSVDAFRLELGKGAEMAREASFKSAAFESSSAPLMMVDASFAIIAANPAVSDLLQINHKYFPNAAGFDPVSLIGAHLSQVHPDGKAFVERVQSEKAGGNAVLPLGDLRFTIDYGPVVDAQGNTIGYVLEWDDATEAFLTRGVMNAIRDGQVTAQLSLSGTILEMNENFSALIGKSAADVIGKDCHAISHDLADAAKALTQSGQPQSRQFQFEQADGKTSMVDGSLSLVRDVGGEPVRQVLIGNDVTESAAKLQQSAAERARIEAALAKVVDALRHGLERLSNGDLTVQITETFDSEYEGLRVDFNNAMENLREAIERVVENTELINSESSEISSAADDLAARTERQASTLEETATALDQLTSSVKSAADGATRASRMVGDAKSNAEDSGRIVGEAVDAMGEIETSSEQISKITSLIDDIAFQTNLLALNAGVEAARAGEAGRGFAVVASEVRALAQRSSDAAREINGLISSSGVQVKRGVELVGQAGEALRGIVVSVTEIANHVDEIASSSGEQSVGLGEINASVNQLDQVTQQNAAMFEETTAASHALARQVETLKTVTGSFNTGHIGKSKQNVVKPDFSKAPASAPINPEPTAAAVNDMSASFSDELENGWEDF